MPHSLPAARFQPHGLQRDELVELRRPWIDALNSLHASIGPGADTGRLVPKVLPGGSFRGDLRLYFVALRGSILNLAMRRIANHKEQNAMKRRTLDFLFSAGGLAMAALLLVLGLVMTSNANFAKTYVKDPGTVLTLVLRGLQVSKAEFDPAKPNGIKA